MADDLDLVVFVNEDGDEKTMEVLDYFFYEGEEYALLTEYEEKECEHGMDCECEGADTFIMRVLPVGADEEEFVPPEEHMMDRLILFVQNELYAGGYDEDEDDEDDEDEDDEDDEDEDPGEA